MAAREGTVIDRQTLSNPPWGIGRTDRRSEELNVGEDERWVSAVGGGALAVLGLIRGGWSGALLALLGGGLVYRGVTGHCNVYEMLDINTAQGKGPRASVAHGEGIKV